MLGVVDRRGDRRVGVVDDLVQVALVRPPRQPLAVDVRDEARPPVHGDGQRLGPAHPAAPRRHVERALERPSEVPARALRVRLVRALQDALRPDVDPRPGRHLAVHDQALGREVVEVLLRRPVRHKIRVRDEHPRRIRVRPHDPHRLAGLHQQRLISLETLERSHDGVERRPRPRRLPTPAVDDQPRRVLRDVGVQIVHEHAHGGLGLPRLARPLRAPRGPDRARPADRFLKRERAHAGDSRAPHRGDAAPTTDAGDTSTTPYAPAQPGTTTTPPKMKRPPRRGSAG